MTAIYTRIPSSCVLLVVLLCPKVLSAQSSIANANRGIAATVVPAELSCPTCRITARALAELGTTDTEGELLGFPRMIARTRDGRYVVPANSEPPFIYDSTGRYLGRLGRLGDGPGEFRAPRFVAIGPGDSLFVYESPSARVSVFDPNLKFVRTFNGVRGAQHLSVLSTGQLLATGSQNSPDRIGLLYHLINSEGDSPRTIGEPAVQVDLRQPFEIFRKTAAGKGDRFWSAKEFYEYRIEEWSTDGRLHRVLTPRSPWFKPYQLAGREAPGRVSPTKPALPDIWALWTDESGRIWVAARIADTSLSGGFGPPVGVEGGQQYPIVAPELVWNTVIEVIDPSRAVVVARATFPWVIQGWVSDNRVFGIRQSEDGGPIVDVWQLNLLTQ
jgi:hypothetical protein